MEDNTLPNPFLLPIVANPRDDLITIEDIHKEVLEKVVNGFHDVLEKQKIPRLGGSPKIVMLLSRTPGSGKSHLLGRLWRELDGRATMIYLRAQDDRASMWQRILERLIQEIDFPDKASEKVVKQGEVTQLDSLARHLLAEVLIQAVKQKLIKPTQKNVQDEILAGKPELTKKLRYQLPVIMASQPLLAALMPAWLQKVRTAGLQLVRSPVAWLKVLAFYTLSDPYSENRIIAMSWMQGCELEEADLQKIGLTAAEAKFGFKPDNPNTQAFDCLWDLCRLGSFYRPFIFAFDQTEIFIDNPEGSRAFGAVLANMRDQFPNQLTVVTANEQQWMHQIAQNFTAADKDRFSEPLSIQGIGNQSQAAELIGQKMLACGYSEHDIQTFTNQPWLTKLFTTGASSISPRTVQQNACTALDAWLGRLTENKPELETSFERHRLRLLQTPKALNFDIGVLNWAFKKGLSGLPGIHVQEDFKSPKGHINVCWIQESGTQFFIMSDNTHFKRWQSIVTDYKTCAEKARIAGQAAKAIAIRHKSLKPIGAGMRKQIEAPDAQGLKVIELSDEQMAELYAGQALYAEVCGGDISQAKPQDVFNFLNERLAKWPSFLAENSVKPPPQPAIDSQVLAEIISTHQMLSWSVLQVRLQERGLSPSIEAVLVATRPITDKISVISAPNNHFFQWKS